MDKSMKSSQNNFRRKLKLLLKQYQRLKPEHRVAYIACELHKLGYTGTIIAVAQIVKNYTQVSGKMLGRIGRAALKKGKLARLFDVAISKEPHTIVFNPASPYFKREINFEYK